eukprot:2977638-Pyramimonas_sp.AAC.2
MQHSIPDRWVNAMLACRKAAGLNKVKQWGDIGSRLDPPAALKAITVVVLEPKFTPTIASVARACRLTHNAPSPMQFRTHHMS